MPIKKSAKKAIRQSEKKRSCNTARKIEMKSIVKKIKLLSKEGKNEEAKKLIPQAYKAIDKAAKIGYIKDNTADRKKSRITKSLSS